MANKAQTQLQSLLDMQGDAQNSAANLAKLGEARTKFVAAGGDEADFALPEAAATAIGASFILGPVGGILLGVAQGILGKQEKQSALDAYASDMGILEETNEIFNDEFDRMALGVTNPDDLAQLTALQTQQAIGMRMSMAASPEMQQQGANMIAEVGAGMNEYAVRQETQQIAMDENTKRVARELTSEQQSIAQSLHDDYDSQSANYEQTIMQSQAARTAIETGDPISLNAALIMVNKALDPTSVVRPEEAKALGNVGTLIDQARAKLGEWIETGAPITDAQRKELIGLVDTIDNTVTKFQGARDMRFQERAIDAELPDKYVNDFRRVQEMPTFQSQGFQDHDKQVDIEAATNPVIGAATEAMEFVAPTDGSPSMMDKFKDWYSGSGRDKRRAQTAERNKRRQTN